MFKTFEMLESMRSFFWLAVVGTIIDFCLRKTTKGFWVYMFKTCIYGVLTLLIYSTAQKDAAMGVTIDDVILVFTFAVSVFETLHNFSEFLKALLDKRD